MADDSAHPSNRLDRSGSTWVEEAARGDLSAFDQLVRKHAPLVFRLLRLRLGEEGTVERVAREVFCRTFENLPSLEHPLRFLPMLLQTVHDAIRASVGTDASEVFLEDWEESRRFAELTDIQQEVLRLRYLNGLGYEEIGRALEIEPAAVSLALRQVKARLRLGDRGPVES